jgi:hypothetical protein
MDSIIDTIIERFKTYRMSHPNLSQCWLSYLELKKRHYDDFDLSEGERVLSFIENGCTDLNRNDMIRLFLYKHSII